MANESINTPVGPMRVPRDAQTALGQMTDAELYAHIERNGFVEPFALGELIHRNKYLHYQEWRKAFYLNTSDQAIRGFLPMLPVSACGLVCQRSESRTYTNIPRVVVQHSPAGYEWGYAGSGPAELALNTMEIVLTIMGHDGERLNDLFLGECYAASWRLHQDFKGAFLIGMPKAGAIIPFDMIRDWVTEQLK